MRQIDPAVLESVEQDRIRFRQKFDDPEACVLEVTQAARQYRSDLRAICEPIPAELADEESFRWLRINGVTSRVPRPTQ